MRTKIKITAILLSLVLLLSSCCEIFAGGGWESESNTRDSSTQKPEDTSTGDIETMEYVTLYQNGTTRFDIVYSAAVRKDSPRMDAIKSFYNSVCNAIGEDTGTPAAPRLIDDANYTESSNRTAIFFGETTSPESVQIVKDMEIGSSGFCVVNNKIVIYGIALDELQKASGEFIKHLNQNATLDENKKPVFRVATTASKTITNELVIAKLPKPNIESELLLCDAGDRSRLWVAENCTMEDFTGYIAELRRAGFTVYTGNRIYKDNQTDNEAKCNIYATLFKDDIIVNVWYTLDGCLRITADSGFDLLPKTADPYQKIAESGLTIVGTGQKSQLMFFLLEDGRFVVIDGGLRDATAPILYDALRNQAPDPNNITIACWIFTHGHGDHFGAFSGISKEYSQKYAATLKVESFMYNFPGDEQAKVPTQNLYSGNTVVRNFIENVFSNAKRYKVRPGNELTLANMRIEVLGAHESFIFDYYPEYYNACNLFLKITINNQVICIEGDNDATNNITLAETYGTYLKCDILQADHHGDFGGVVSVNLLFSPQTVLFLNTQARMNALLQKDYNQALVDVNQNPNFKEYICHNSATIYLPLPYTPGSSVILTQNPTF